MNDMAGIINRTTLAALLAVQVVVVGVLIAARSGGIEEPAPFLVYDPDLVDGISVSNSDGSVALAKVDGIWQLDSGIPAARDKAESMTSRLSKSPPGWPVANTGASRERFEVTEDNHQRHIVLNIGDETVADIFLGTSPGYQRTHARRDGDDDVYAIKFSNWEAGVEVSDWMDRSALRPKGELTMLGRRDGFELTKNEDGDWTAADGSELDPSKVATYVGRFTGISASDVSEATLPESAAMTFVLADDEGEQTLSVFALPEPGEDGDDEELKYVAVSDRIAGAYDLSKYIAEQMDKTLADLGPDPEEDEDGDAEAEEDATNTGSPTDDPAGNDASAADPAATNDGESEDQGAEDDAAPAEDAEVEDE